jgi:hypothetical protein
MSAKELVLDNGGMNRMRVNDIYDSENSICLITENHPVGRSSMMMVLDRAQQHMLFLYLQERLNRTWPNSGPLTNLPS